MKRLLQLFFFISFSTPLSLVLSGSAMASIKFLNAKAEPGIACIRNDTVYLLRCEGSILKQECIVDDQSVCRHSYPPIAEQTYLDTQQIYRGEFSKTDDGLTNAQELLKVQIENDLDPEELKKLKIEVENLERLISFRNDLRNEKIVPRTVTNSTRITPALLAGPFELVKEQEKEQELQAQRAREQAQLVARQRQEAYERDQQRMRDVIAAVDAKLADRQRRYDECRRKCNTGTYVVGCYEKCNAILNETVFTSSSPLGSYP